MNSLKYLVAAVACAFAPLAHAGLVTINGSDVSFTYDPANFVDGPGINANSAAFLTNTISAAAGGSALDGSVSTASSVTFTITLTNANESFNTVALSEHGSYELSGPNSSVSMNGSLMTVSAANGSGSMSSAISPTTSITQNDGVTHGWDASASDNLSTGSLSDARSINVTIYNTLTASASAGSTAQIAAGFAGTGSNDDGLTVTVSQTPLPNSIALFLPGVALLAGLAKRSSRKPRLPGLAC
jgi:hypothetical protein